MVKAHAHNQPDHKFSGKFTFSDTGFICGIKDLRNPFRRNSFLKAGE
jgi:hypothetical protein